MEVNFTDEALEHLKYFKKINNPILLKKIKQLIESIVQTPYNGIGKPEALKYNYIGFWSRRINQEHRLVYKISEDKNSITIYSLKGHY